MDQSAYKVQRCRWLSGGDVAEGVGAAFRPHFPSVALMETAPDRSRGAVCGATMAFARADARWTSPRGMERRCEA